MPDRTLIELLHGDGAHANTLACVEDVPMEIAGRRAGNLPHSIWQLVSHMNYWMDYELKRIRGERPVYPKHAAESWRGSAAPVSEEEWRKAVVNFGDLLRELAMLAGSAPDVLEREIDATHADHAKRTSTLRAVLWQTAVHNSYHIGQVAMLRRNFGAWPPKGGGDSW